MEKEREDEAFLIHFEDAERTNEMFGGFGAREGALKRYAEISQSWNATLYQRIKINWHETQRTHPQAGEVEHLKRILRAWGMDNTPFVESELDDLAHRILSTLDQQPQSGDVRMRRLLRWLDCLANNPCDPNEPIADNGGTIWQYYQWEAKQHLAALATLTEGKQTLSKGDKVTGPDFGFTVAGSVTEGKPDGLDVEPRLSPHERLTLARDAARYFAGYSFSKHEESQCAGLVDALLSKGYKITPPATQGEK